MEYELDYILFAIKDIKLDPNMNEVKETKYISRKDFIPFLESKMKLGEETTPWFQILIDSKLLTWWDILLQGGSANDFVQPGIFKVAQ